MGLQSAKNVTLRVEALWVILVTCVLLAGCGVTPSEGMIPQRDVSSSVGPKIQSRTGMDRGCAIGPMAFDGDSDAVVTAVGITVMLAGVLRIVRRLRKSRAETGKFQVSARWSTPDA